MKDNFRVVSKEKLAKHRQSGQCYYIDHIYLLKCQAKEAYLRSVKEAKEAKEASEDYLRGVERKIADCTAVAEKNYQTALRGGIPEGTEYRVYDNLKGRCIESNYTSTGYDWDWVLQMWNENNAWIDNNSSSVELQIKTYGIGFSFWKPICFSRFKRSYASSLFDENMCYCDECHAECDNEKCYCRCDEWKDRDSHDE
jgi:hypothetical protein